MKRILSIILAVFMAISNTCVVFANEEVEFYAYTSDTSGFDEYASDKFSSFIYGHYGYIDDKIKLGIGITVFNENDYPKVLYPVWKNNEIIGTFTIVDVDGEYSGTYRSKTFNLNELISVIDEIHPVYLISNDEGFYGIVDNVVYNMNGNFAITRNASSSFVVDTTGLTVKNANDNLEIKPINNLGTRTTNSSFANNWHTYRWDYLCNVNNYCYAYCLYNIFRNLGITAYSFDDIKNGIVGINGMTNVTNIQTWLTNNGFAYTSSSSGSMEYSSVYNVLHNWGNYIMVGLSYVGTSSDHYMAMYGCAQTNGNTTYSLWDPQSHEDNNTLAGLLAMDGDSKLVVDVNQKTLKWDAGYFGRFTK